MATIEQSSSEPPTKKLKFTPVKVQQLVMQTKEVKLLPIEQLLRQLLLDCRDDLLENATSKKLDIRFTGGWVRDKLLGIQSPDIDVALSSMTGIQFGQALQKFVSQQGTKYEEQAIALGAPGHFKSLHQIAANPEKSKHLETVTTQIFGLDIDLVNLRKETYTEDSRNPQMEFGTPEEDALRRDATVNALFFNLDSQQVEDFTKRGLEDMDAGIIRTPLDPHQTFMDDPLRVLRLVRFASKLGYQIAEDARASMKDEKIHHALNVKISRERVGVELGKMMNGPNPLMAFQLIYESNLWATVFLDPLRKSRGSLLKLLPQDSSKPWPPTWPHAYQVLNALMHDNTSLGKELTKTDSPENLWILAAYAPSSDLGWQEAVMDARGGIKATNKVSRLLEDSVKNQREIRSLIDQVVKDKEELRRSTIGFAIKCWGPTWRLQVLYSLLSEVVLESDEDFFSKIFERYDKFLEFVINQNLLDAFAIKPLLRGDELLKLFAVKKSGPWLKTTLDEISKWQFDHEKGTKEEVQDWLITQRKALNIP